MAKKVKIVIGRSDVIALPEFGVEKMLARIDTGAYRSSLHCKKVFLDDEKLHFILTTDSGQKEFSTKEWIKKKVRSSNGKSQERFIIKTKLAIFNKTYTVSFSLTDRSKMKYPILIGRKFLMDRFIVDVSKKNVSENFKKP